jgi:RNA polymerase sigma-19 factor, ECF subfamily
LPHPVSHTEKALFQRIVAGDEHAFRQIFDLYKEELYNLAYKLTKSVAIAEETTQDVFVGLWISRAHLKEVDNPASYIYKTLLNRIHRYLTRTNQQRIIMDALRIKNQVDNTTEEQVAANESRRLIDKAINKLPPQQRKVYQLSHQHGLSTAEIAHELNISPLTAKSYLRDAMKFIRSYLRDVAFLISLFSIWQ